jgi:hypothetical protein
MTIEQLNKILNAKAFDYKFLDRKSKDKIIISVSGLGINQITKNDIIEEGTSIFDLLPNHKSSSPFEFYNLFTKDAICSEHDILFLADTNSNHYIKGINGIANNIEEIKDFIYNLVSIKGYKIIYFIGTCSGGWLASFQTLSLKMLNKDNLYVKALLFNPLNDLSESGHFKKHTNKLLDFDTLDYTHLYDYNNVIDDNNFTNKIEFNIYYSKKNNRNNYQAMLYKGMASSNIKIKLYEVDTDVHNLAQYLKQNDKLSSILINFLQS